MSTTSVCDLPNLNNCVAHDASAHNLHLLSWADTELASGNTFLFLHEQVYAKAMYPVYEQMYCCLHGVPGLVIPVWLNKTQVARRRVWHFNFPASDECNRVQPKELWHCVKGSRNPGFFPTCWQKAKCLWKGKRPVPLPTITTKIAHSSTLVKVNCAMHAATALGAKLPGDITHIIRHYGLVPTGVDEKTAVKQCLPMVRNLTSQEAERIMGFSGSHTAMACSAIKQRHMVGNAWHGSVASAICSGLKHKKLCAVISFFDGIGTIHLTLQKLGLTNNLKVSFEFVNYECAQTNCNVYKSELQVCVSVDKDKACKSVVENWWQIQQRVGAIPADAVLLHYDNIMATGTLQSVMCVNATDTSAKAGELLKSAFWHSAQGLRDFVDIFDLEPTGILVTGGSPCNNISGNNRRPSDTSTGRSGLSGFHSGMFLEFASVINNCFKAWHTDLYTKWKLANPNLHFAFKRVHKGLKRKRKELLDKLEPKRKKIAAEC